MKTSPKLTFSLWLALITALAVPLLLPSIGHAETWTFDPSFQRTPLRVTSESASSVKVLSSGKVLTYSINGGLMSGANGQRIGALVRIDPNTGAIDPTWSPDPTLGFGFLGVAEAPDGKIYYSNTLTGDLANSTDPAVNRLIRLNTDGSRDTSFNSPIFASESITPRAMLSLKFTACSKTLANPALRIAVHCCPRKLLYKRIIMFDEAAQICKLMVGKQNALAIN